MQQLTSHKANSLPPQSTAFVLAGFFKCRLKALAIGPPAGWVPKAFRYNTLLAANSASSSLTQQEQGQAASHLSGKYFQSSLLRPSTDLLRGVLTLFGRIYSGSEPDHLHGRSRQTRSRRRRGCGHKHPFHVQSWLDHFGKRFRRLLGVPPPPDGQDRSSSSVPPAERSKQLPSPLVERARRTLARGAVS